MKAFAQSKRRVLKCGFSVLGFMAFLDLFGRNARASVELSALINKHVDDETAMKHAFEMRQLAVDSGDQSYGAVVVKDNKIIGVGPSRVVTNTDPSAHAEMEAIRDAAKRLGQTSLKGAVMYSSSKPCPMCEAAGFWAGVERLVYTKSFIDGGAPRLLRCD